jgi:hypothetical protein
MDDLLKLAEDFEKDNTPSSLFKIVPYIDEAKQLALLDGKLHHLITRIPSPLGDGGIVLR